MCYYGPHTSLTHIEESPVNLKPNILQQVGLVLNYDVPSELSKTEEKGIRKTFCNLPKN
jgi:hypothetical protein